MQALTVAGHPAQAQSLAGARYVSITTFRRDGRSVATPVEFVVIDGGLYFMTMQQSGKVKRIRHEARVLVAPCTMRGNITGHKQAGVATLLAPEETAALLPAFRAKYGAVWNWLRKLRRSRSQGVRVNLVGPEV